MEAITEMVCCRDAEAVGSSDASASCYGCPENIGIVAIVESEAELGKVQRQIFLAHVVIGANDPALQERPERFHVVRVDEAAHVLAAAMIDGFMRQIRPAVEILIARVLIGRDQFNLVLVHDTIDEAVQRRHVSVLDHLADHVAFAGDGADNGSLVASAANVAFLIPMAIGVSATHVGLINFDDPHQLPELRVVHRGAQPMAHIEGRAVGAGADGAMNLKGADALLAGQDHVENSEPSAKRIVRVLENRLYIERKAIASWIALLALPVPRLMLEQPHLLIAAAWALDAVRPTARKQIRLAGILIRKHPLELRPRHLHRELWNMSVVLHNPHFSANASSCQVVHSHLISRERRPVGEAAGSRASRRACDRKRNRIFCA